MLLGLRAEDRGGDQSGRGVGEAVGHEGASSQAGLLFQIREELLFEVVGIDDHFTGGDLFLSCAVEAQLADAEGSFFF